MHEVLHQHAKLATKFAGRSSVIRSDVVLTEQQIMQYAPSVFAGAPHINRSARYVYIPTIEIIRKLKNEGFEPFMACQTIPRDDDNHEFTKHMIRLRHASQIMNGEANEIVLLNSHNGTSSYQMLAGVLRSVCKNSLVCGTNMTDIRLPHKGDVIGQVIEGAYTVLDNFRHMDESRKEMKDLQLSYDEQRAFATAALTVKYDTEVSESPITAEQVLGLRRIEDDRSDLWTTFNRVQENLIRGGLTGRNASGRRTTTRPVNGIDQNIKINRALWVLAEEMKKIKS